MYLVSLCYTTLCVTILLLTVHPGSYDSSVRVWDCRARSYDPIQVMGDAKDSVTSLQLTTSEILTGSVLLIIIVWSCIALLLSSSVDGTVRRYDLRFGKLHCDTIASLYIPNLTN